jgi:hypothetical protein
MLTGLPYLFLRQSGSNLRLRYLLGRCERPVLASLIITPLDY